MVQTPPFLLSWPRHQVSTFAKIGFRGWINVIIQISLYLSIKFIKIQALFFLSAIKKAKFVLVFR